MALLLPCFISPALIKKEDGKGMESRKGEFLLHKAFLFARQLTAYLAFIILKSI